MTGRFEVVPRGDGALLVDLETGNVFGLNATAARAARALGESREAAVRELEALGAPRAVAERDVAAILALLDERPAPVRANPVAFEVRGGVRVLHVEGQPVLEVEGRRVRGSAAALEVAAPHLLALAGTPVLHASSAMRDGRLVAFSGASGAGKTTTAELAGAVSRDVLPLAPGGAFPRGEAALERWVRERAPEVARGFEADLEALDLGPVVPIGEAWLLDASRRDEALRLEWLEPVAALAGLLENGFLEVGEPRVVRELARTAAGIERVAKATVPRGLEALRAAVTSYMRSSTS